MTEPSGVAAGSRWAPATKRAVKMVATALVLAFVVRHVLVTRRDLLARGVTWEWNWRWLAGALGLYLAGLTTFGIYFWRVLANSATPVGFYPAVRAYLVSHLAKYVPGKAMVVVVRSALVVPDGARPATAAFATLYETLTMMAAGGGLAAAGFLTLVGMPLGTFMPNRTVRMGQGGGIDAWSLVGVAVLAGLGFLVLVWPTIFPRLAGLIRKPLLGVGADALPRFTGRLLTEGLAWSTMGWILLGLSQVAVLSSLVELETGPDGLRSKAQFFPSGGLCPAVIASVALATVAGFAVPISPGGLGVREWVLWTALGATLDRDWAVVAALTLRMVWIVGEIGVAGLLYVLPPRARRAAAS